MSGMDLVSNVVPALMLVIGAPLALWWWTRRNRGAATHRLRITDKAALGRSLWVAVVEVDDKRFLVGAGEGSVGLISELEDVSMEQELASLTTSEAAEQGMDPVSAELNGITERPRMGLVERLQHMTLRTPPPPSARPFRVSRR
ncbi:MAG: flagellar biosynthetic protein FliO [bacterium]|nr:flagellar biosynthetic protein FliO [bacterium]